MDVQKIVDTLEKIFGFIMPVSGNGIMVLLPVLQAVLFVVGLIRLLQRDNRKFGGITIANCLLYLLGIFLIENGHMSMPVLIIFGVGAIVLSALNLAEKMGYNAKETLLAMGIYILLLAVLVGIQIFVSKQSVGEYFGDITMFQWGYIALFFSMGLRHLEVGIMLFFMMGGSFLVFRINSNDDDITAWATGEEQSVDTVSMSD